MNASSSGNSPCGSWGCSTGMCAGWGGGGQGASVEAEVGEGRSLHEIQAQLCLKGVTLRPRCQTSCSLSFPICDLRLKITSSSCYEDRLKQCMEMQALNDERPNTRPFSQERTLMSPSKCQGAEGSCWGENGFQEAPA